MTTCRAVISRALRAARAIEPGDMPHIDQLTDGLCAVQDLILELHEARGPLRDVDVDAATYIPSENQRIRVQAGTTVVVTLPNAIPMFDGFDPYDYGFDPAIDQWCYAPQGTTGEADGIEYRQPRDGARIEIVGTTTQLFFYRTDINQWLPAYGLGLDTEIPLNNRYAGAFGALVAERVMSDVAMAEPPPSFIRRAAFARQQLFMRAGTHRPPVRAEYF